MGPGDGPPPGGDGGTGGDGGSNPPGGDGGSDGGTKPGGGDNGSSGGGGGGGGGGGNPPDGNGDGNSGGDGDGSGSDGGAGSDGGDGSGGLKEPKQGSFDKTIKEYDDAIAKAQKDFQELQGKFESVLASKFDIHLGTGGGSLPCWDFTALGQRFDVCLTEYAKELSVIRYVVLFIAAMLAGWIVFYRS
ncbi:TPA: coat protein [Pseudomonas aeruginosa]|nr:coat protein [Pseudomonas aeruginosa]